MLTMGLRVNSGLSRLAVAAFDAVFSLLLAVVWISCTAPSAFAYVDPSVMTYTIQALAGVAVALSAVLGVVWRRVRRFLLRVLRIDENAGKVDDGVVRRLDVDAPDYADRVEEARRGALGMRDRLRVPRPESLCAATRLVFSLIACFALTFTVVVVGPLELVASNPSSLFFTVADVWVPLAVCAVVVTLVGAALLSLLKGRAFSVALALVALIAIAAYVQVVFFNASLPAADGNSVDWGNYTKVTVASSLVWLVLIVGGVVLALRKPLAFKGAALSVCLVCVLAQAVSLTAVLLTPGENGFRPVDERPVVTMDGVDEVSSKGNVIMFVLDTFDVAYLNEVLQEDPGVLDEFTGFTNFKNSTGLMIPTRYAFSTLMTGQTLQESDAAYSNELIASWYERHNLIDDMNELGYEVDLYATDISDAIASLPGRVRNIHSARPNIDPVGTVSTLVKCSLYRDAPWIFKPFFWFYTDEVNNAVLLESELGLADSTWTMDDARYHEILDERGVTPTDIGEKGSFRVIHLAGTHAPYTLGRDGYTAAGESSCVDQGIGALTIVAEYIKDLKELGLYDEATIVVTADHGEWYLADEITGPTAPLLMVKPSTEAGGSSAPVKTSDVPTGHVDLARTLIEAMGGDGSAYGGMNVFDVGDEPRTRYYCATSVVGPEHEYTYIKQWEITGDVLDWESWRETGVKWPIE